MTTNDDGGGFRADLLERARAWRQWLEYELMNARDRGDEIAVIAREAELNMLSIVVESARAHEEREAAALVQRLSEVVVVEHTLVSGLGEWSCSCSPDVVHPPIPYLRAVHIAAHVAEALEVQ